MLLKTHTHRQRLSSYHHSRSVKILVPAQLCSFMTTSILRWCVYYQEHLPASCLLLSMKRHCVKSSRGIIWIQLQQIYILHFRYVVRRLVDTMMGKALGRRRNLEATLDKLGRAPTPYEYREVYLDLCTEVKEMGKFR